MCAPDNFPGNSASFKCKQNVASLRGDDGTKNVEMMVPLKYLTNFWKTLEMPLTNCEIDLTLTSSVNCVVSNAPVNQATTFAITDTKLYVPVVNFSAQDNAKLLKQLKSGYKRAINWNKYHPKNTTECS